MLDVALSSQELLACLGEIAQRALTRFGLPTGSTARLINLSENATYRVDTPSGARYALRVHRHGYHSRAAIRSELDWVIAIRRDTPVLTPAPVTGCDGDLIQEVAHPRLAAPRHCVLFAWEDGSEPQIGGDLAAHFETLGELTATMHTHARHWPRPSGFTRQHWTVESALGDDAPLWGRWRDGLGITPALTDLFAATVRLIAARLAAFGNGPDRAGLVHGDLRLANLLLDGSTVKVLDFDDCGFSWYLYDAATPVSFHEDHPEVPHLIRHWITGYRRTGSLSAAEEEEIATFIMMRRLLLVAWVGSHQDADYPRKLGSAFTEATAPLCRAYLASHG